MRIVLPLALLAAPAFAAEPITGRWRTQSGNAIVTIQPCGKTLCGRIQRVLAAEAGPAPRDARNPDPALRGRPLTGLEILSGFTDAGKDWRGRIYDPESGKSYRSIIARVPGGLKVQGCVTMFCRSQAWKPAS